jgi:spore photoproduct lyase
MLPFEIERIYLDEKAEQDWVTRRVLKNLAHLSVERIADKKSLIKEHLWKTDPLGAGKKNLLITHFYGKRLKPCPGTSRHICCGYHVISPLTNCPMDCSYCVLQDYLNNPLLTLHSNLDDLLQEVDAFLSSHPRPLVRLGTGELSDSLALDPIVPLSEVLVPFFSKRENGLLELKTKSVQVDSLLSMTANRGTVISWSLNPQRIIEQEERRTASLSMRIEAAKKCQERGYPVGFHFDPMFFYDDWEDGYRNTVQEVFRRIDPGRVIWISLGGFRYPPELKNIARERFPETRIFLGELFPGKDAKFRYLKAIRIEMYRKMVEWLREVDPRLFVYLCMESHEVWESVFGWTPENSSHLNQLFEERVKEFLRRVIRRR